MAEAFDPFRLDFLACRLRYRTWLFAWAHFPIQARDRPSVRRCAALCRLLMFAADTILAKCPALVKPPGRILACMRAWKSNEVNVIKIFSKNVAGASASYKKESKIERDVLDLPLLGRRKSRQSRHFPSTRQNKYFHRTLRKIIADRQQISEAEALTHESIVMGALRDWLESALIECGSDSHIDLEILGIGTVRLAFNRKGTRLIRRLRARASFYPRATLSIQLVPDRSIETMGWRRSAMLADEDEARGYLVEPPPARPPAGLRYVQSNRLDYCLVPVPFREYGAAMAGKGLWSRARKWLRGTVEESPTDGPPWHPLPDDPSRKVYFVPISLRDGYLNIRDYYNRLQPSVTRGGVTPVRVSAYIPVRSRKHMT